MEGQISDCRAMRERERSSGGCLFSIGLHIQQTAHMHVCLQGRRMCSQATRSAPLAVARIVLTMLRLGVAAISCRIFLPPSR
eukprot:1539121-Pleurochrysis_carterae.AAC.1